MILSRLITARLEHVRCNGLFGGTVEGDAATTLATLINEQLGTIIAETFDILQSLATEEDTDCDSLSLVLDAGGVVEGAGG